MWSVVPINSLWRLKRSCRSGVNQGDAPRNILTVIWERDRLGHKVTLRVYRTGRVGVILPQEAFWSWHSPSVPSLGKKGICVQTIFHWLIYSLSLDLKESIFRRERGGEVTYPASSPQRQEGNRAARPKPNIQLRRGQSHSVNKDQVLTGCHWPVMAAQWLKMPTWTSYRQKQIQSSEWHGGGGGQRKHRLTPHVPQRQWASEPGERCWLPSLPSPRPTGRAGWTWVTLQETGLTVRATRPIKKPNHPAILREQRSQGAAAAQPLVLLTDWPTCLVCFFWGGGA